MEFTIKGYPTEISDYVELPSVGEMINLPFIRKGDVKEVMTMNDTLRKIIEKAPIRWDMKYVVIDTYTQYLTPNYRSLANLFGTSLEEWHIDGANDTPRREDTRAHLILNPCTAMTEFNAKEVHLPYMRPDVDTQGFIHFVNLEKETLGLEARAMEPNRFITFYNHLHKCGVAKVPEFRLFLRITESEFLAPVPLEQAIEDTSYVYYDGKYRPNIVKKSNGDFEIITYGE